MDGEKYQTFATVHEFAVHGLPYVIAPEPQPLTLHLFGCRKLPQSSCRINPQGIEQCREHIHGC
jgi:hypothetical protein